MAKTRTHQSSIHPLVGAIGLCTLVCLSCFEDLPGDEVCRDVGYSIANKTLECTDDVSLSNERYENFMKQYHCLVSDLPSDEALLDGVISDPPRDLVGEQYECASGILNLTCAQIGAFGEDYSKWLVSASPHCAEVYSVSANAGITVSNTAPPTDAIATWTGTFAGMPVNSSCTFALPSSLTGTGGTGGTGGTAGMGGMGGTGATGATGGIGGTGGTGGTGATDGVTQGTSDYRVDDATLGKFTTTLSCTSDTGSFSLTLVSPLITGLAYQYDQTGQISVSFATNGFGYSNSQTEKNVWTTTLSRFELARAPNGDLVFVEEGTIHVEEPSPDPGGVVMDITFRAPIGCSGTFGTCPTDPAAAGSTNP